MFQKLFAFSHSKYRKRKRENTLKTNWIEQGDCFELIKKIPDKSVDLIFTDLPYGTTNCKWDSTLPLNDYVVINQKIFSHDEYLLFEVKCNGMTYKGAEACWNANKEPGLWTHYNRILKDNGVILLFAQTPFDKILGASNPKMLKYEWIWEKTAATGHLNAKKMPMKAHENILVFYKNLPVYNPQMTEGHTPVHSYTKYVSTQNKTEIYGKVDKEVAGGGNTTRYPRSVLKFPSDKQTCNLHPTQKPVALCEYLIRTYTNAGAVVFDSCAGSGTIPLAALNTGRSYIAFEKEEKYFQIMKKRLRNAKKIYHSNIKREKKKST